MTKIKATNKEMLELLHGLYSVQELKGVRFAVAVSKNINKLKDELSYLDKAGAPSEEFSKLMDEAQVFIKAEDEVGMQKLEEDNKEIVDARKAQLAEVEVMLEEEVSYELMTLGEDILPADISAQQVNGIIKILE